MTGQCDNWGHTKFTNQQANVTMWSLHQFKYLPKKEQFFDCNCFVLYTHKWLWDASSWHWLQLVWAWVPSGQQWCEDVSVRLRAHSPFILCTVFMALEIIINLVCTSFSSNYFVANTASKPKNVVINKGRNKLVLLILFKKKNMHKFLVSLVCCQNILELKYIFFWSIWFWTIWYQKKRSRTKRFG